MHANKQLVKIPSSGVTVGLNFYLNFIAFHNEVNR